MTPFFEKKKLPFQSEVKESLMKYWAVPVLLVRNPEKKQECPQELGSSETAYDVVSKEETQTGLNCPLTLLAFVRD